MFSWQLAYIPNAELNSRNFQTISDIQNNIKNILPATVPGSLELDLMKNHLLDDIQFSTNLLQTRKLENLHVFYFCKCENLDGNYLLFKGIDTYSEIFVNGEKLLSTDNMFLEYKVYPHWQEGENEIVVHISPAMIEARKNKIPHSCDSLKNNFASLSTRKVASSFGWDIMPRNVSIGLWKNVEIHPIKENEILSLSFYAESINKENKTAYVHVFCETKLKEDDTTNYTIKLKGKCKTSTFCHEETLWHTDYGFGFRIENAEFWEPKGYGEPNVYDIDAELLYQGKKVDTYKFTAGLRIVKLVRKSFDENGEGDFHFEINGRKIFCMGSNWVPADMIPALGKDRLEKMLSLCDDVGLNILRCWGGGYYEFDEFYNYCDTHGILVWQDFMMACGLYPQNEEFQSKIQKEGEFIVKRLRNHPCLLLFAGDNECDYSFSAWHEPMRNPNDNVLTRKILKYCVENYSAIPYLPSSPFFDENTYMYRGAKLVEDHLWGPRDYFKGNYYKNAFAYFVSEIGYHGFPTLSSLQKFLKEPKQICKKEYDFQEVFSIVHPTVRDIFASGEPDKISEEYLIHGTSAVPNSTDDYSYRVPMAINHILTLFGKIENNFEDMICQSQISQAEAFKYFIEKVRIDKRCGGIIWWNLIDGWPQISDAVCDYYGKQKLAYFYIKRSQQPLLLAFDEPKEGKLNLYATSIFESKKEVSYSVIDIKTDKILLQGKAKAEANTSTKIAELPADQDKRMLKMEYTYDNQNHFNHYFTNVLKIDYHEYVEQMKKCGIYDFQK